MQPGLIAAQAADISAPASAPALPGTAATLMADGTAGQSAAAQAAGALVAVERQQNGTTRLTIAMAPPAIGAVTIHIDQGAGGTSSVAVTATHPATLAALRNDQAALTQALNAAGIATHHQGLTFHLDATSPASATAQGGLGQNGAGQNASGQGGPGNGGMDQGGAQAGLAGGQAGNGAGQHSPGQQTPAQHMPGQQSGAGQATRQPAAQGRISAAVVGRPASQPRFRRFGLDLTA